MNAFDPSRAARTPGETADVVGVVVPGDRRGRELGFPTANVPVPDLDRPDGVYAGVVVLRDGSRHLSAISIGTRPTYYSDGERLLEANLLDFQGDLYGQLIRVELLRFLRPQVAYTSEAALIEQLAQDVAQTRELDPSRAGASAGRPLSS